MPVEVVATADGQPLRDMVLRLRAAGEVELKKQMAAKIRLATLPARQAVTREELAVLPKHGGLNQWVAASKPTTRILTGPKTAGVVIRQVKKGHDYRALNRGRLRHPLFGNRNHWYTQQIPAGWFERPLYALAPAVQAGCVAAMHETASLAGFHDI